MLPGMCPPAAIRIQNDLALSAVGDYLRLVGMQVRLTLRRRDPVLESTRIEAAEVVDLSDSSTHLLLADVRVRRWLLLGRNIPRHSLPVANILKVEVLDRRGRDPYSSKESN